MTMEIRQLRYFIAVAEEGHITRAAARLDMQQPPLSRQIKAIERELDVQLFYRMARGVELTDAGRTFLDRARSILASMESAFDATRSMARGEQGRISVGVMPTGPFHPFVPRVIRKFREKFPTVTLSLRKTSARISSSGSATGRWMSPSFARPGSTRSALPSRHCWMSQW
jgi:DNA-binding transcriptional LysR family regulator